MSEILGWVVANLLTRRLDLWQAPCHYLVTTLAIPTALLLPSASLLTLEEVAIRDAKQSLTAVSGTNGNIVW